MYLLSFCSDMKPVLSVVGKVLGIFKIVIPLLIIIFGMIDLGKAVVASDDKEVKKAAKQLGMRLIAGIVIFFIPTIVGVCFSLVDEFDESGDYETCKACITSSSGC